MNTLLLRGLTGLVYIVVIVLGVLLPWPAPAVLILLLGVPAAWEYNRLFGRGLCSVGWQIVDTLAVVLMLVATLCRYPHYLEGDGLTVWKLLGCLMVFYFFAKFVAAVFVKDSRESLISLGRGIVGLFYIGLPLLMLWSLIGLSHTLVMTVFVMIWANDTGAFLVGSRIGKRRLCERLSPKKSWEGLWGGMAFCVIVGVISYFVVDHSGPLIARFNLFFFIILGILVSVMATVGDLFESMLKRVAGVKDAGHILPGHGGMLDRVDSLLFVFPTVFFLAWLLNVV